METSSPLAALRPGFGQRDIFRSHGGLLGATSLGGGLHDQYAFQRPNEQYFNLKTVRGSSPAASLAADLSQNFKLNDSRLVDLPPKSKSLLDSCLQASFCSSPMFPTPRRALFTTATMMGTMDSRGKNKPMFALGDSCTDNCIEYHVTTPPLPASSSPAHVDMMDMSPLPHKAPYVAHVEICSPTPNNVSPADEMMLESPMPVSTGSPCRSGVVAE